MTCCADAGGSQLGTMFKRRGEVVEKQGGRTGICGAEHQAVRNEWVKRGPWWRARKGGMRVGAESLGRKMHLGDEGAGGVVERFRVTFGSVGDGRLGRGGNWGMTNPQWGWDEWEKGRWPCKGREKAADADGVVQLHFPQGQQAKLLHWPSSSSFPCLQSHAVSMQWPWQPKFLTGCSRMVAVIAVISIDGGEGKQLWSRGSCLSTIIVFGRSRVNCGLRELYNAQG